MLVVLKLCQVEFDDPDLQLVKILSYQHDEVNDDGIFHLQVEKSNNSNVHCKHWKFTI
jgi:hypothetical protein